MSTHPHLVDDRIPAVGGEIAQASLEIAFGPLRSAVRIRRR